MKVTHRFSFEFARWHPLQPLRVGRAAVGGGPSFPFALRRAGFLPPRVSDNVGDWFQVVILIPHGKITRFLDGIVSSILMPPTREVSMHS